MDQDTVDQVILSIDCAVGKGSVAVLRGSRLLVSTGGGDFQPSRAEEVLAAIRDLLGHSGLTIKDVEDLVVSIGPGSYSGIRIGMATALGIGKAVEKTPVGVSILDALALTQEAGAFLAAVEVGKGHVASSEFLSCTVSASLERTTAAVLGTDAEFLETIGARQTRKIVWTDALSSRLSGGLPAEVEALVPQQTIAELIAHSAMRFPERTSLAPLYLRDQQSAKNG